MRRIGSVLGVNNVLGALSAFLLLAGALGPAVNAFSGLPRYSQVLLTLGVFSLVILAVVNWRRLWGALKAFVHPAPASPGHSVTMVHQEPYSNFGGTVTATGNVFMQGTGTGAIAAPRRRVRRSPNSLRGQADQLEALAAEFDKFTAARQDGEPAYPMVTGTAEEYRQASDEYRGRSEAYTAETHRLYMAQFHPRLLVAQQRAVELGVQDQDLERTLSILAHSANGHSLRDAAPRLRVVAILLRESANERSHGFLARLRRR